VVRLAKVDPLRPAPCLGTEVKKISGAPDTKHLATSYVERRTSPCGWVCARFTRLTNAFSRKAENLAAAVALHFMHYNFARPHQTLSKKAGKPTAPRMAAGVADHVWSLADSGCSIQTDPLPVRCWARQLFAAVGRKLACCAAAPG